VPALGYLSLWNGENMEKVLAATTSDLINQRREDYWTNPRIINGLALWDYDHPVVFRYCLKVMIDKETPTNIWHETTKPSEFFLRNLIRVEEWLSTAELDDKTKNCEMDNTLKRRIVNTLQYRIRSFIEQAEGDITIQFER
jgi:hypothetical protein